MKRQRRNAAQIARIIAKVCANGSDTTNLRDAAHEAHHALDAGLKAGKWDRESIHRKLIGWPLTKPEPDFGYPIKTNRILLLRYELDARAVEQLVCKQLGEKTGDIEHWALYGVMEALKGCHINCPFDMFVEGVRRRVANADSVRMRRYVDRILALGAS